MLYNGIMYLCIDIGGTKTIVALVNARGKILHSVKFETPVDQKKFYELLLEQIHINFVMTDIIAFGVAMPGIVKDNRATWLGNLPWKSFDIAHKLEKDFKLPAFVENDANLAALAETRHIYHKNVYYTFSTGIGGGVTLGGKLSNKYRDFEPGHEKYLYHGKKHEWEDLAAASAVRARYGKLIKEITDRASWDDIIERMLLGLIPQTIQLKPDCIIFGGPLGLALPRYRRPLSKRLAHELPKNVRMPRLLKARHGSFSVIKGCYLYAKANLKTD